MTPDQIREAYLSFFERRGHTRYPSDSLVPENDPTLLFTGAGMNQFKAMFLGKGNLPFTRATTSQKCLRMPDLENVGRTASHHTFFEMLGNFSFGDYFKRDAIRWAWELLSELGVPGDRLSATVYLDDDEAWSIWRDEVGLPEARLFRCGEDDNFWPAGAPSKGPNGICGPCSEIYFDFQPEAGAIPAAGPGSDSRRFVEIWNLVFTQFERQDGGRLAPLPKQNIDTGMGFERVVRVIESMGGGRVLASNFETQLFAPLLAAIHAHVGRATVFGTPEGTRVRRIADHVRAATFCIGDGVRPGNLKQGYVVRKILRRAMLDRHVLGGDLRASWLAELSGDVVQTMAGAFPELRDARAVIASTIAAEEEKFAEAFLSGSQRLAVLAEETRATGHTRLPGASAFLLYDTFGLPLDLQKLLLEEQGLDVDEDGFRAAMTEQRRRSREGSRLSDRIFDEGPLAAVSGKLPATEFVRGTLEPPDARLLAVVDDAEAGGDGEQHRVLLVLDRTPFYAEGGGQAGDSGTVSGPGWEVDVDDTVALRGITLHRGVVVAGQPVPGPARARVDAARRAATARNHTGTHLLHAALREVLGPDCTQAGSLVAPDRLRFDFRFPRALTAAELVAVEDLVNAWILANAEVQSAEMPRSQAREQGAMALFGEKYGELVRVVRVPDPARGHDSVELCGGTHVRRSGDIGLLRILSEGSIAAGIRRIEARTGHGVIEHARATDEALRAAAALFKASPDSLRPRIEALQDELRATRGALDELRESTAAGRLQAARREWHGLQVVVTPVEGVPVKMLRDMAGDLLKRGCDLVLLAVPEESGTSLLAAAGPAAQKRGLAANALLSALAEALGGKGGGNAAFAQGRGGPAPDLAAVLQGALEALAMGTR
jgi:alanyl-tRNA synthetase